jgi:hypothetical protein
VTHISTYDVGIIYIQHGRKTQLLHVFQEDFILNNLDKKSLGKDNILSDTGNEELLLGT